MVTMTTSGRVTAVSVLHELLPNPFRPVGTTAIDKRPVSGRVGVDGRGLTGDTQCDREVHGGSYQAVYAYADEEAAWWAAELGRDVPPGLFAENLRTSGIDVSGAEIGERWRIGDGATAVEVEVTSARIPCRTFQEKIGEPHWVRRFGDRGLPGAYLRVLVTGDVGTGDPVTVVHRPGHGITVADTGARKDPERMARLLAAADEQGIDLKPALRESAQKAAARLTA
jgi:MOSC domain-containing protein YiiM